MSIPIRPWRVPCFVTVQARGAADAKAKAIGLMLQGKAVPLGRLTVGEPVRAE